MNFKRKKPKNARGGCLLCKYWKINGYGKYRKGKEKHSDWRRRKLARLESNGDEASRA